MKKGCVPDFDVHNENDMGDNTAQFQRSKRPEAKFTEIPPSTPGEPIDFIDDEPINNDHNDDDINGLQNDIKIDGNGANDENINICSNNLTTPQIELLCGPKIAENGYAKNCWLKHNASNKHSEQQRHRPHRCGISGLFRIWKLKFLWDYQCVEEDIYKEVELIN